MVYKKGGVTGSVCKGGRGAILLSMDDRMKREESKTEIERLAQLE